MFLQLVVLALAAVAFAEPEADPLLYYTNTYNYNPVVPVAAKYAAPNMYYNPAMYYNAYNPIVYTAPVAPVVAKEAEPVVEADKVEEKTDVVAPVAPMVYTVPQYYTPTYTIPAVNQVVYKAPSYYAQSAPGVVHQVAKREAEANADAQFYGAYGYGYPAYGYRYGAAYPAAYRYGGYPYAYGYGK